MARLEDLARFENANSALAFREAAYGPGDAAQFLQDALALANAEVDGPRFLFVGVRDRVGGERAFPGVTADAIAEMRRVLPALLARAIEPPFKLALRALTVDNTTLALLCFSECDNAPYLTRRSTAGLPAGVGWLRRGTRQAQLTRIDLERLFAQRRRHAPAPIDVSIAFAGNPPRQELELPVLDLAELPSAVAASRLRRMLEAKEDAKNVLGRTETRFDRLLHAQIFGMEQAYEPHSDESLRVMIARVTDDYADADRHYELAVRAHALELVACNRSSVALECVMVRLRLPNIAGLGVADRLYSATGGAEPPRSYPSVHVSERVIDIEASLGSLPAGATAPLFREPPRLTLRAPAAGKTIALDYVVHARELREPLRDSLVIRIVPAAGARPPRTPRSKPEPAELTNR
jgi:hypothetical protein